MEYQILKEQSFDTSIIQEEGKDLYIQGPFMKAEYRNQNGRVYPRNILEEEVNKLTDKINNKQSILGELDHSDSLEISLSNVSHDIQSLWWEGDTVCGKAKVLESTPKGQILKGLLESGVSVGVSSRAGGSLDESTGQVKSLKLVTVDCVATPSAGTYPQSIREALEQHRRTHELNHLAEAVRYDEKAQKYFQKEIRKFIENTF